MDNASEDISKAVRVIYGGSASAGNCSALIEQANIDGFLLNNISENPREIPCYIRGIEVSAWEKMNDE